MKRTLPFLFILSLILFSCDATVDKTERKLGTHLSYADAAAAVAPIAEGEKNPRKLTIAQYVVENKDLTKLARIFESTPWPWPLDDQGPYIFFAPSDKVLDNLPDSIYNRMLLKGMQDEARKYILSHAYEGSMTLEELQNLGSLPSMNDSKIKVIFYPDTKVLVEGKYARYPVYTKNGTVYIVDNKVVEFPTLTVPDSIKQFHDSLATIRSNY